MGIGALVTTLCLVTLTDFIQFNCKNLPFLSYDPVKVCCRNQLKIVSQNVTKNYLIFTELPC